MLIYYRTSLLESTAQTVVNTVNCVGVMGKGIAHAFKQRYPDMFEAYKKICDEKLLQPGKLWLWRESDQWVLNFPTKQHWRNPSRLEWIEAGLRKFVAQYDKRGITEISFPRLGCGNGGLDWADVRPIMESYLIKLPIRIYIHDFEVPLDFPEHAVASPTDADGPTLRKSFSEFARVLQQVITSSNGLFKEYTTKRNFCAELLDDQSLEISHHGSKTVIDPDHLMELWNSLARGLLTKETVSWSAGDQADFVIALLSNLPDVRPVQVQKPKAPEPEIALELRRKQHSDARAELLAPSWA